jgi:alpha-tubulin suppressor-like RCC1 family protein
MSNRWKGGFIQAYFDPLTEGPLLDFGPLYAWGENQTGQLGQNDQGIYRSSPVQVGDNNWSKIVAGGRSDTAGMVALKTDGTLWTWGFNQTGECGVGDTINRSSPTQVGALTNWRTFVRIRSATAAIKTDGTLWTWGGNDDGELGLSGAAGARRSSPTQVGALTTWLKVSGSYTNFFAIKTDGTLWFWGGNGSRFVEGGVNTSSPVQIGSATNWASVEGGYSAVAGVTTSGILLTWGSSYYGQLGLNLNGAGTYVSSPTQVGALTNWSKASATNVGLLALKTDGTIWGCGAGGYTGQDDAVSRSSPVQIGSSTDWRDFDFSAQLAFLLKTDDSLWGYGINNRGQLGINTTVQKSSPTQIGADTDWKEASANLSWNGAAIKKS